VISTQFTLEMCVAAQNHRQITKPLFWGSTSFKVIDINTLKKLIINACCDKQHVYAIVFTLDKPITAKQRLLRDTPL